MFSPALGEGRVFNLQQPLLSLSITCSTAAPHCSASAVDHSEGLRVLQEVGGIGVLIGPPSLSLLTKELLQWVLTDVVAEKEGDSWYGEEIPHQFHNRTNCMKDKKVVNTPKHCYEYVHTCQL